MTQRLSHLAHEPPVNELPAALVTPDLVGRGDAIALAIPSLLVYSTGMELLIICRYREGRAIPSGDPQEIANTLIEPTRQTANQIPQLITVNAWPVEGLGGLHDRYGFTYRAWAGFRHQAAGDDLVVSLDWPGIEPVAHRIAAAVVADAVGQVTRLW